MYKFSINSLRSFCLDETRDLRAGRGWHILDPWGTPSRENHDVIEDGNGPLMTSQSHKNHFETIKRWFRLLWTSYESHSNEGLEMDGVGLRKEGGIEKRGKWQKGGWAPLVLRVGRASPNEACHWGQYGGDDLLHNRAVIRWSPGPWGSDLDHMGPQGSERSSQHVCTSNPHHRPPFCYSCPIKLYIITSGQPHGQQQRDTGRPSAPERSHI